MGQGKATPILSSLRRQKSQTADRLFQKAPGRKALLSTRLPGSFKQGFEAIFRI
jgi:hypothetical protein